MLSKNSSEPQASPLPKAGAGAADPVAAMDPHAPIEGASSGDGTGNDSSGNDRPPGFGDSESLRHFLG